MKRREFCRQFALVGGAIVLAPLIKGCAPADGDPTPIGDLERSAANEGRSPATAAPTAAHTPDPTRPPQSTAAAESDPTQAPQQPADSLPDEEQHPRPSPTTAAPMAAVALVKTSDRAFGVRRAIELLGAGHNPVRSKRVLFKPNYNSADAAPASTHPDILRSLILEMNEMGARSITLGERSGMGDTRAVLAQTGVFDLAGELGFETLVFDELEEKEWIVRRPGDSHWQSGFAVPRILLDSECVVQTCNLKTHRFGGQFTMSLKNSVGFVARTIRPGGYNYMEELHNSPYQRQMVAEVNAVYRPALIVMDGVEAFVDGGPARGKLASPSVVLAGSDPVAMDAVGVAILRMLGTTPQVSQGKIFEQEQIARAAELGLGIDAPQQIQFVTGDAESAAYARLISPYLT